MIDFNLLATAIMLYYEQRGSLFAEQVLAERLGEKAAQIRSEIQALTNTSPERLIAALDPVRIKRTIAKTTEYLRNTRQADSAIHITLMSPEELQNGGERLLIRYQFSPTPYGAVIIASTVQGVCYLAFADEGKGGSAEKLKNRFPRASFTEGEDEFQREALALFADAPGDETVKLHLKGTPFQLGVWQRLLDIPPGGLMSYSALSDDPRNSHALGAAVGSNPVAYIIPCHRAVRATGEFGDYHWGIPRKAALICLESVLTGILR